MKIYKSFLGIALFLISLLPVSCAPLTSTPSPVSTTATPTVSPAPAEPAVSPTKVTVPSDWVEVGNGQFVSPDVIKLQDQVAATKDYTLVPDGKGMVLETKLPDGTTAKVPGFVENPDGTMTLTIDGQAVPVTSLTFGQDGKPQWLAADGSTYSFDGTKIAKDAVPTGEMITAYEYSTDPYEFRNSVVPAEAVIPKEKGGVSDMEKYLQSQAIAQNWSFDETKVKTGVRMIQEGDEIVFDPQTAPNFPDRQMAPEQTRVYFTVAKDGVNYLAVGVQLYKKGVPPDQLRWMFGVDPNTPGYKYNATIDKGVVDSYKKYHYPAWIISDTFNKVRLNTKVKGFEFDPLVHETISRYSKQDMQGLVDSFMAGNLDSLAGMLFTIDTGTQVPNTTFE